MGSVGDLEQLKGAVEKMQIPSSAEEKILVLVRLRPLNDKEIAASEVADWECINDTTILYRNTLREGSTFPSTYTFDRVFRGNCLTRQVYDNGAKEVALSVVKGVNSSIFAYGQTSSGKTYTMMGITEYTVADIFDYIHKHEERAFVLKFSAIEIYNEAIRDLLSTDGTPLRLLDDPEKGTIVEKVTEETLKDWNHLKELLSVCEAQRRIGETSLNEKSSRSHQILRLSIESSAREFLGKGNSTTLVASVNFVDLAGSERASQALSSGARLKEGCHINRSLLTLGTVIRKLSKGRHGHINYRDSKLTRLLQPALGGNARTAIICTLSPARSHVEQTRNTLLFACCAKEVTTKAQVNVVMSDKALVKHLQKELARLESELRSPAAVSSTVDYALLLRKKDLQIQKMEKEIMELAKQKDLAESRVQDLLRLLDEHNSRDYTRMSNHSNQEGEDSYEDGCSMTESGDTGPDYLGGVFGKSMIHQNGNSRSYTESGYLQGNFEDVDDEYCKEVQCVEMNGTREHYSESSSRSVGEREEMSALTTYMMGNAAGQDIPFTANGDREATVLQNGITNGVLERTDNAQWTVYSPTSPYPDEPSSESLADDSSNSRSMNPDKSCISGQNFMTNSSHGLEIEQDDGTPPREKFTVGRPESVRRRFPPPYYDADIPKLSRSDSQSSIGSIRTSADEDIPSIHTFVAGLQEAKQEYEKELADGQDKENGAMGESFERNVRDIGLDPLDTALETSHDWPKEFERKQREILELWQTCNVSLIHRTYFFLLLKGDQKDSVYMEVELRRLSFLKESISQGNRAMGRGTLSLSASIKALHREKRMLSKLMSRRLSEKDRMKLYEKFGIPLNSKLRRQKLANCLWSNTKDINHVLESAAIVARLIRFSEKGEALKEMFGLSFTPPNTRRRSLGWSYSRSSLL